SLGALPLALSLGDAATSRIPLGIVIVGGIMFSLVFTLLVVPAVYSYLSTKKRKSKLDEPAEDGAHPNDAPVTEQTIIEG
ncbi:MAG: efflux RND transporter permease subunit, partial [Pedobacter sp.]